MSHYDDPYARLELAEARRQAEQIHCDYCQARIGEACQNKKTGEPLRWQPAHIERMKGASD